MEIFENTMDSKCLTEATLSVFEMGGQFDSRRLRTTLGTFAAAGAARTGALKTTLAVCRRCTRIGTSQFPGAF